MQTKYTETEVLGVDVEQHPSSPTSSSSNNSLLLRLYLGHFLARWGARMWEFSVGLYMIHVWPDSLLLAAAYGVVESASAALVGPFIGQLVDKLSYIQVVRLWLLSQNFSYAVAGGAVIIVLVYAEYLSANHMALIFLVVLINISGAVAVLSTLAGAILIEREWVVVISEGQSPGVLAMMNSSIRRIDLTCKLFAPVLSGFIISFISLTASAVTLALWNVSSVSLQYWLLMSVYNGFPKLKEINHKRLAKSSKGEVSKGASAGHEQERLIKSETNLQSISKGSVLNQFLNLSYINAWLLYIKQDMVLAGIALALLYFSVLSFGTLMSATLEWQGVPTYAIGIGRGISAVIGIAATFLYPMLESRVATLRIWSIWSQWSCLLLCVGSVFVKKKLVSAYMLMVGVASSRLGLWVFDLSVVQQMQDQVAESERCIVGGVQNSLESVLNLMTYIMGIIIFNPQEFWKLIMISFVSVTLAAAIYSVHVYRVRKHLFHFDKLVVLIQSWHRPLPY